MIAARFSAVVSSAGRSVLERPVLQLAPIDDSFVGRDHELTVLVAAIVSGARRVWITGASGFGKTELLAQLATRCRKLGLPYHWVAPHEPATPSVLCAIAEELASATGVPDRRRLLVIDDFALLRPIERWFVEQFLPTLPASIAVVVADRAAIPVWRVSDDAVFGVELAPLADWDAGRYLERRGVAEARRAEIIALAEGIPAILVAAADAACAGAPPGVHGFSDDRMRFYTRHDSDDHRLAIAVLVTARTTPYELLELAFDNARAARAAFAWLSRLSVVDHTPHGLRPHALLRRACERELAAHDPGLWARGRRAARVFADYRISVAREPLRWLLDRLFVERDLVALREYLILPVADVALVLAVAELHDRSAIAALAAAHHGDQVAGVIARWLDDDRATFDVLRDPSGGLRGYLCSVVLSAASPAADCDPAIDQCVAHLRSIGWFGLATPPDACALVFRDWTVAGAHQMPSEGAALLIAQMACRLLITPAVEFHFVITDRPELWHRLIRFLGLEPRIVGEYPWGDLTFTVIVTDWRQCTISTLLQRATDAALNMDRRPSLAVPRAGRLGAVAPAAPDGARDLSLALERRIAQLAKSAALSPREQEVLHLLLLGRNCAEIGIALRITPRTARFHQHNVLEKIGAESRLDIIRLLL